MDVVPAVDIECINNPILSSFCGDDSIGNTELDSESHSAAITNCEKASQRHHGMSCFYLSFLLTPFFKFRVYSMQFTYP